VIPVDTNDQTLYVARIRLPDQVDASSSEANIPVTMEVMTGWDGATNEPSFSTNTNESELGLSAAEISGLQHTSGTTCTVAGCPLATSALTPVQLYNLLDSDNELANGSGFLQYQPASDLSGILDANLVVPSWLWWDWDGDGTAEAPSTMLLFGDYQGKAPILFIRPGFR
jgi:MSHA biogenesis protein MshQ